ncbi:MAG: endonuclease/exonuclease/phosphatase family protein [Kofleriaceae bacterium]
MRVVTINFWGTEEPLDLRLNLAIRQLRAIDPDVICMQEVKAHGGATTAHTIANAIGMHALYGHGTDEGGGQGVALITRKPLATHELVKLPFTNPADEQRVLLSGEIDGVWVHTTHLNYRLDDGVAREHQVLAIDDAIRARRTLTSPPQILCGDFNATPDSDEIRFLRGLHTLGGRRTHFQDAWMRLHPHDDGITWSSENEQTRPLRSLDIDRRIDFIFVTSRKKDGRGTIESCSLGLTDREQGNCASDHYAVIADITT